MKIPRQTSKSAVIQVIGNKICADLEKGLTEMFRTSKLEFVENKVENSIIIGNTAVETCIFGIKGTPKNGGKPTISRGRSMVVYVRYKESPTG